MMFVNGDQTPEERKLKYWFAKKCGCDASYAQKLRSLRWKTIVMHLYLKMWKKAERKQIEQALEDARND